MSNRVFQDIEDLIRIKNAYRDLNKTPGGRVVLRDLAKVCNAASTTFDKDPHEAARQEGKRQVWLRIQRMINMPDDEVYQLANGDN